MRATVPFLVVAAFAALTAVLLFTRGERSPAPAPGGAPGRVAPADDRLDDLARENRRLREEIGRLGAAVEELRDSVRSILARPPAGPGGELTDPAALLDRYVASFADGGEGAKYYELAVDAAAPALRDEIGRIVLDPGAPNALRARLTAMLGTGRFRGDRTAIRILLELVRADTPEMLARTALAGLVMVADPAQAGVLQGRLWELPQALRDETLGAIVSIAGDQANRALLSLLLSAPDESARARVVSLTTTADPDTALDIFTRALGMAPPVRTAAARRLVAFRGAPFRDLVSGWIDSEPDPGVLGYLKQTADAQTQIPRWDAMRATGPPDVDDITRDHPNAWAAKTPDAGREWLELTWPSPLRVEAVRVHEVYTAGAVAEILARTPDGDWRTLWAGTDSRTEPGVFEATFAATTFRTSKLRIVLDTARRPGWNEIDTVEIVGPDGRAFPVEAIASSNYGQ